MSDAPLLAVRDVVRSYAALRPLRMQSLTHRARPDRQRRGLDAAAAEVFVGLLTGALLPDSGEVELFGLSTRTVADSDAWLKMLDGVGILTDRAVLIAQFTVEQNIAMPFTLEIDPVAPDLKPQVAALAREVGLPEAQLTTRVGGGAGARPRAASGSPVRSRSARRCCSPNIRRPRSRGRT